MIDLAILGLLSEHDLHGYELKKRLAELPGTRASVSFGSLYPALARLDEAGHVKAVDAATAPAGPVPMTGSLGAEVAAFRARHDRPAGRGRRNKKVYGITDAGRAHLVELLTAEDQDRAFTLRVAFCGLLDAGDRLALFTRRRAQLAAHQSRRSDRAGDRYRRALRDRDDATTSTDLAWLDRLIAAEQADPEPGTTPNGGTP
ncbi:PadR family transcriptional regulator [soil metagenome]